MRVGIVGCGEISRGHLESLQKTKICRVVSVCDINRDKAEALAKKYNISKVYTDFSLMLQKEKLDLIHVLTPPQVHAPLSIKAMDAGCHVLVEKPMCMTEKEADQMIEAAKRNGVKLGVVHSFLFNPAIRNALALVRKREIGELLWVDTIVSIHSLLKWKDKPGFPTWYSNLPGGLFGEIIPHGLYVSLAFLGRLRKVVGVTRKSEGATELVPFSELKVVMDCENALGGLFMSARPVSPYTIVMVRAFGSDGILLVNVPTATVFKMKLGSSTRIFERAFMNLKPALQLIYNTASLGGRAISKSVRPHMTHEVLIKRFVESVQKGSDPPVTPEEGKEVVKAINLIWENILP